MNVGTQVFRYLSAGVANTFIGVAAILLLQRAGLHYALSNFCGYVIGLLLSYFINKKWTFEEAGSVSIRQISVFLSVFICAFAVNIFTVSAMLYLLSANIYLAQVCGVMVFSVLNFLGMQKFAFSGESHNDGG